LLLYSFVTTKSHKYLYGAAIAFGVGIHSQYILAIYLPAALLSLFLTTEQDRVLLTTKRIRAMFCSSSSYIALLLLFISAAIILIPRFLEFGIIYTERVQHGSLVSLHAFEWKYYIRGMLASYSWPVLAFATLGLFTGIRTQQYRLFAIFCLLWILDIFCFFTFLYTWKDIRFLIYLAVPLYILAAIGVVALFSSRRKLLAITAAAVLIYFNSSTTTTDPWDVTISLTPAHALEHRYNQGWQLERKWSIPFLLSHYLEAETFSTEQRQSVAYSTPLTELFASLSQSLNRNTSLSNKLVYFESVGTHDYYIIANRNILYARDFVTTVTNEGRLLHLIQSEPLTLILKEEDARRLGLEPTSSDWSLHHGPFVAIQTSPETAPRSLMPKRYQNLGIASVEAREHPERLFDGILDQSENYAAAPYGSPIEVNFTKSKNLKSLRIYLWDFDERSYRFQLYLKVNETWDMVEMNLEKELTGVVEVPVGVDNVQAIRIVGSYNSDEQKNPSNTSLHIKEIELIGQ
ncbi:MAG: hypothetical protein KDD70_16010, partial [Bdellovibrionales bacterium]|nr:hypothetical protein [Bdellovibrionales bacterium]